MLTFEVVHGVIRVFRENKLITSGRVFNRRHAKTVERKFNQWAAQGWPPKEIDQ